MANYAKTNIGNEGRVELHEKLSLTVGDWVRISPATKRQFFAADNEGISFVCIQTKENSLESFTANDAVVY